MNKSKLKWIKFKRKFRDNFSVLFPKKKQKDQKVKKHKKTSLKTIKDNKQRLWYFIILFMALLAIGLGFIVGGLTQKLSTDKSVILFTIGVFLFFIGVFMTAVMFYLSSAKKHEVENWVPDSSEQKEEKLLDLENF